MMSMHWPKADWRNYIIFYFFLNCRNVNSVIMISKFVTVPMTPYINLWVITAQLVTF